MNLEELQIADKVLRIFYQCYRNNQMIGTKEIEKDLNIDANQLNDAILYLEADGYIQASNKGYGTGPVYKITKTGFAFFSKTTLEKSIFRNEQSSQIGTVNHFHGNIKNTNLQVGNDNYQTNVKIEKQPWYKEYLKEMFVALLLLLVGYLTYFFGWK